MVIIPARLGSTRLPRKVLLDATGLPLVQHAVLQARKARMVEQVIVAADCQEIADALAPFGTEVILTDPDLPSGTDRVAVAARQLQQFDIVVNVQGDEPEMPPSVIDAVIASLRKSDTADLATAACPFPEGESVDDPTRVKVVTDRSGRAMYFSRSRIPFIRDDGQGGGQLGGQLGGQPGAGLDYRLHLGIYAYRWPVLQTLARLAPTPLEQAEKLEQLRALEHGMELHVAEVKHATDAAGGIDTPQQYEAFVHRHLTSAAAPQANPL